MSLWQIDNDSPDAGAQYERDEVGQQECVDGPLGISPGPFLASISVGVLGRGAVAAAELARRRRLPTPRRRGNFPFSDKEYII